MEKLQYFWMYFALSEIFNSFFFNAINFFIQISSLSTQLE